MIAHFAPNGKCPCCNKRSNLDVHHIRYKKIWDVHTDDLVVLCRNCHEDAHKLYESKPFAKQLNRKRLQKKLRGRISMRLGGIIGVICKAYEDNNEALLNGFKKRAQRSSFEKHIKILKKKAPHIVEYLLDSK